MKIDGYTRMAAVVARPIKHSISPFIHNTAFEATGVNGVYLAWDIAASDLEQTVANIRRYDMFGINLSMPYKQAVIPFLDDCDPAAKLIGAVNTVVNNQGRLIGYNTDGYGFFKALSEEGFEISDKSMTILGSGGAATAIIAQAALTGAGAISVFRRQNKLEETRQQLAVFTEKTGVAIQVLPLEDSQLLQEHISRSNLLVNATSLGMDGQTMPLPDSIRLPKDLFVSDVIYQPFETPFLAWARAQGLETNNGFGMLLYQAAKAFELWTGKEMPTAEIWTSLAQRYDT